MIGYHYTTWEAYQQIKEDGLQLSPLEKRHEDKCRPAVEFVKAGCIWVYSEFMQGYEQIGMILYVAFRHDSHRVVCLEVDYAEWASASRLAYQKLSVTDPCVARVELTHGLEAGLFGHQKRFDLITTPVLSEQIHLVGKWNLLDLVQQRVQQRVQQKELEFAV